MFLKKTPASEGIGGKSRGQKEKANQLLWFFR
jgi:hypothetical protein